MPLYDFHCQHCGNEFETIVSNFKVREAECPKCGKTATDRLVARFRVGGRGDLRESTLHGCHAADPGHDHHHDHSHDHSKKPSKRIAQRRIARKPKAKKANPKKRGTSTRKKVKKTKRKSA